ncbi:sugar transferase [Sphingobacteriales bacterium UPWRP_1]|nr:hypothetical protein BVG80_07980 [Sphingobacteriales bacterium TSM_CSM]PSJ78466.1 sugar transferase [Sphingobacteriales bacterium UPWRP_1]
MQKHHYLKSIPFIVVSRHSFTGNDFAKIVSMLQKTGLVDDFYALPADWEQIGNRIEFLSLHKASAKPASDDEEFAGYVKMPMAKRIFDIIFSFIALIVFGPLMLLIALAIKLESKGPVLYKSKRAGAGYRIFNFYKFRSMTQAADKELNSLSHLNQYAPTNEEQQAPGNNTSFVKISNDPRVTRVGWFIRKTSLDELPQLINVLKGDMSVVGNRPLPLYEAQQLTRDIWAKRFLAPAGITGLWQVTKRGKANMSAEERIQLDNDYAQNCSFKLDLLIILKTFPAMLQKEEV